MASSERHTVTILLDPAAHPVIGHRGAAADAPENTLPSFLLAVEQGADAIEMDVHVTADDIAVVLHDPTLDRTTNATGAVAALPFSRVREADAGARYSPDGGRTFPWRDRGVRVPTLEEVIGALPPDMPLLIEIKTPRAQRAVRAVLERTGAAARSVVAAFQAAALQAFADPPFVRGACRTDILRLLALSAMSLPIGEVPYRAICPTDRYWGYQVPIERIVRAARTIGRPVHVWTIDDIAHARRLWDVGVSGIITNRPGVIRAAREESREWAVGSRQ